MCRTLSKTSVVGEDGNISHAHVKNGLLPLLLSATLVESLSTLTAAACSHSQSLAPGAAQTCSGTVWRASSGFLFTSTFCKDKSTHRKKLFSQRPQIQTPLKESKQIGPLRAQTRHRWEKVMVHLQAHIPADFGLVSALLWGFKYGFMSPPSGHYGNCTNMMLTPL